MAVEKRQLSTAVASTPLAREIQESREVNIILRWTHEHCDSIKAPDGAAKYTRPLSDQHYLACSDPLASLKANEV